MKQWKKNEHFDNIIFNFMACDRFELRIYEFLVVLGSRLVIWRLWRHSIVSTLPINRPSNNELLVNHIFCSINQMVIKRPIPSKQSDLIQFETNIWSGDRGFVVNNHFNSAKNIKFTNYRLMFQPICVIFRSRLAVSRKNPMHFIDFLQLFFRFYTHFFWISSIKPHLKKMNWSKTALKTVSKCSVITGMNRMHLLFVWSNETAECEKCSRNKN